MVPEQQNMARFIRFGPQAYAMDTIRMVECENMFNNTDKMCTVTYQLGTVSPLDKLRVFRSSEQKTYQDIKDFRDSILSQSEMDKKISSYSQNT